MARSYLASEVIASLKRRALLSSSGTTPFADSDWLAIMDEEIRTFIWPLLREENDGWFLHRHDVAYVTGTTQYRLPARMLGEALKLVEFTIDGTTFLPLPRLEPTQLARGLVGYWLEDDLLTLAPGVSGITTMRLMYYLRPSMVVDVANVITITSNDGVATLGGTVGLSFTAAPGDLMDVVSAVPGLRVLQLDNVVASFTTPNVTLTDSVASLPASNAYLCRAEETPVPQIPAEAFPLLAQSLVTLGLEGRSGYREAVDRRDALEEQFRTIIKSRSSEGGPNVVQNFHAPGWGGRRGFRGRYS